jgi:formate dehydrogenase assembly factor FdhD
MPHSMGDIATDGSTVTRCGHLVAIFNEGVDAVVYTAVTTEMFITTGCGTCRNSMMRDLHDDLKAQNPNAKAQLRDMLAKLEWQGR